jgi:serine/threonine-protein phosphatase CPPED1
MNSMNPTRRQLLKAAGAGLATAAIAVAATSCARIPWKWGGDRAFTFAQICDTQLGMGGHEHDVRTFKMAVRQINALKPDFAVICGDLVNHAKDESFADFNAIKAELTVPCYYVPGNHDVGNKPTPRSLKRYRRIMGEDYFSLEHEGYVFAFVNSQLWKAPVEGETQRQDAWLEETLAAAAKNATPVFVVGHYPLFLKHPDEGDEYMNLPLAKRQELLSLFEESGVVAVLGGHTHRLLINEYNGIQLVNGENTSNSFDKRPFGFRLWRVEGERPFKHEFVPLAVF